MSKSQKKIGYADTLVKKVEDPTLKNVLTSYPITPKFKTPYNSIPDPGESFRNPSLTLPDQTLSIKQIMDRYASGRPLTDVKTPHYNGEDDDFFPPNFDRLDLIDRKDLLDVQKLRISEIRQKIDEKRKQTEEQKQKQAQEELEQLRKYKEDIQKEKDLQKTKDKKE